MEKRTLGKNIFGKMLFWIEGLEPLFFRQDNGVKLEASKTGNDPIKTFTLFLCKLDRFNAIKNLIRWYKMV